MKIHCIGQQRDIMWRCAVGHQAGSTAFVNGENTTNAGMHWRSIERRGGIMTNKQRRYARVRGECCHRRCSVMAMNDIRPPEKCAGPVDHDMSARAHLLRKRALFLGEYRHSVTASAQPVRQLLGHHFCAASICERDIGEENGQQMRGSRRLKVSAYRMRKEAVEWRLSATSRLAAGAKRLTGLN